MCIPLHTICQGARPNSQQKGGPQGTASHDTCAKCYFFLTFCVSAEAAADFAALLAFGSRITLEAVAATRALVFSMLPFCVSADAATDFSALLAVLLFRTLDAAEATFLLVLSDFAMVVASLLQEARQARPREAGPWQIRLSQGISGSHLLPGISQA